MRIKCVVIMALAADFEQLQYLTSADGLVLLSRYFDGTCDRKRLQRLSKSDKCSNQDALLLSGGSRSLRCRMKSNKPNYSWERHIMLWPRDVMLRERHFSHGHEFNA